MTYAEVISYMYEQLPMFHRIGQTAYKANLDNALFLDNYYKNPHNQYKTIHIAGTNGKGSVSHMLAGILGQAGYKTGLFTSPHLKDFRERIRVNGDMIAEAEVVDFIEKSQAVFDKVKPSFFEMTSALAFYYFAIEKVDVAIIEVGMGGRLDSTNIIAPVLSVITNIGMDHTEFLGDTLAKIAFEKAGIIKDKTPVVIGEHNEETWPVFNHVAATHHAKISLADSIYKAENLPINSTEKQVFTIYRNNQILLPEVKLDLLGLYQRKNVCTVLTAIDELNLQGFAVSDETLSKALSQISKITGLYGRWQVIGQNPLIVCDTGHNKDGISWVVEQIKTMHYKQLHMVIGFVKDKDITNILKLLPTKATYYFTNAHIPRALPSNELKELANAYHLEGNSYPSVKEGLEAAKKMADKEDFIFVGGSNFVVGEVV